MTSQSLLPRSIFNRSLYNSILKLWFADIPTTATAPTEPTWKRWFAVGVSPEEKSAFDEQCRNVAGPALDHLSPEKWPLPGFTTFADDRANARNLSAPFRQIINDPTLQQGQDALARPDVFRSITLLLDQLPRNIFRDAAGQAKVYSHFDRLSRSLTYSVLSSDSDIFGVDGEGPLAMNPTRRDWLYMPLTHCEDLADHHTVDKVMSEFEGQVEAAGDQEGLGFIKSTKYWEGKHREILEKFGRYPHRSGVLGRESTEAEKRWLGEGGDTFGTSS